MAYWVKRIGLKTGEVVTERELRKGENLFQGPPRVVGRRIEGCLPRPYIRRESFMGELAGSK